MGRWRNKAPKTHLLLILSLNGQSLLSPFVGKHGGQQYRKKVGGLHEDRENESERSSSRTPDN
jgi:hypothetical protein